jgi:hypothetical protein
MQRKKSLLQGLAWEFDEYLRQSEASERAQTPPPGHAVTRLPVCPGSQAA